MLSCTYVIKDLHDSVYRQEKEKTTLWNACSKKDCAGCVNCKDMVKFGGTGKKKCCVQRHCQNIQTKREKSRSQVLMFLMLDV